MSEKTIRPAASYSLLVPKLSEAVKPLGYALALHGSLCRDLDLVAVPWTEDASEPHEVIEAITAVIGGIRLHADREPTVKPHGRLVYTVHFRNETGQSLPKGHPYIDLSVMPKLAR